MRPIVKVLLIVVLATAVVAGGCVGWVAWTTRPQGDPQAFEFADARIAPQLSEATVMALGEATHGNREFQRLRLQLIRKLPAFRSIVIEEDYGSVARANAYLQGGPGTPERAARSFGFALNHTREMVELLRGIRSLNTDRSPEHRIRLVGMDVQRVDANKQLALDALRSIDPDRAGELQQRLADWTDQRDPGEEDPKLRTSIRSAVDELVRALSEADRVPTDARNAATALGQHLDLAQANNYAATRAEIMAANLKRTVAEEADRGNDHTLLFAHNGHVDKASAAYSHPDLGTLASRQWGEAYRVIGTDLHHSRLITGEKGRRWEVTMTNPTPLRGLFAGTRVGYLDFATANPTNRQLLQRPVRMASAGESFQQWQAWIPWLNSVRMVPAHSYDALIMVEQATPVTPLRP